MSIPPAVIGLSLDISACLSSLTRFAYFVGSSPWYLLDGCNYVVEARYGYTGKSL
ncbi:hypothetical protein GALMADRAFT_243848 [Galerina marginata CBS 339.88]|uniref:Uncharacterized protein n=1 Tax=Galerina marginata (strain CBS 339.88) TaxID=685588 RepID=A0A067TF13_GALM3|nr:hypothetical protein GALMADRAFT_243848 [Galerina marginata CBS 339.88]